MLLQVLKKVRAKLVHNQRYDCEKCRRKKMRDKNNKFKNILDQKQNIKF